MMCNTLRCRALGVVVFNWKQHDMKTNERFENKKRVLFCSQGTWCTYSITVLSVCVLPSDLEETPSKYTSVSPQAVWRGRKSQCLTKKFKDIKKEPKLERDLCWSPHETTFKGKIASWKRALSSQRKSGKPKATTNQRIKPSFVIYLTNSGFCLCRGETNAIGLDICLFPVELNGESRYILCSPNPPFHYFVCTPSLFYR